MITDHNSLKAAIRDLKSKQALDLELLKDQFHITYESLKPLNFIKNTVHDVVSSPDIKADLVSNALGLGMGYVSKLIMVGTSHNPLLKVAGVFLQQIIGNVVANNSEKITNGADSIFKYLLKFRFKANKKPEYTAEEEFLIINA